MILGIGVDLIELNRIKQAVIKNKRFINRILTVNERQAYDNLTKFNRIIENSADRLAVKEAFGKVNGRGMRSLSFEDIELLNQNNGAPLVTAKAYQKEQIFVTISHSKDYVVAQIVINDSKKGGKSMTRAIYRNTYAKIDVSHI